MSLREVTEITDSYVGSGLESTCRRVAIETLRENSSAEEVKVCHPRKAIGSIHPTITEELIRYHENI